jgi:hypothetical protein
MRLFLEWKFTVVVHTATSHLPSSYSRHGTITIKDAGTEPGFRHEGGEEPKTTEKFP